MQPEQPAPKPTTGTPIWDLVIEDMRARDAVGLARYGVRLQAGNGRDALRDAYEEALDLAVYLRQCIEETGGRRSFSLTPYTATALDGKPMMAGELAPWRRHLHGVLTAIGERLGDAAANPHLDPIVFARRAGETMAAFKALAAFLDGEGPFQEEPQATDGLGDWYVQDMPSGPVVCGPGRNATMLAAMEAEPQAPIYRCKSEAVARGLARRLG